MSRSLGQSAIALQNMGEVCCNIGPHALTVLWQTQSHIRYMICCNRQTQQGYARQHTERAVVMQGNHGRSRLDRVANMCRAPNLSNRQLSRASGRAPRLSQDTDRQSDDDQFGKTIAMARDALGEARPLVSCSPDKPRAPREFAKYSNSAVETNVAAEIRGPGHRISCSHKPPRLYLASRWPYRRDISSATVGR